MPFRHNKKRNSGLVYEFLVRRLANKLVEQDRKSVQEVIEVTDRYFGSSGNLSGELELFRIVRETRGLSAEGSRRVLAEVARQAQKSGGSQLDSRKSALIRDINRRFGKDFWDRYRIPEYRLLASTQLYLDGVRSGRLSEGVQAIQLEEVLVRWMSSRPPVEPADVQQRVDQLVCAMAHRRFNEKYGDSLNVPQKRLLETYVRGLVTEDMGPVVKRLGQDRREVAKVLVDRYGMEEVQKDPVMKGRYVEAARRLSEANLARADEGTIEEMMLFHKLREELTSDE